MFSDIKFKKKILFCFLFAIELIFTFTILGSLPIGPVVATTTMLPVIIASLGLGLHYGIMLGTFLGFISLFIWTFMPPNPLTAFLFSPVYQTGNFQGNIGSVLASILPRVLTGVTPLLAYRLFSKIFNEKISLVISSGIGSMTNTIFMMIIWHIFFQKQIENIANVPIFAFIVATIISNGIPEMILCMVVCPIVSYILKKKFLLYQ